MSDTYLQDFGHLRKQAADRKVNDPMSSSHRWEELELDLTKPHIPKPRRDAVPSNRSIKIDDMEFKLKQSVSPQTLAKLGFRPSEVGYKHKLVTPKAETYRRDMAERGPSPQEQLHKVQVFKMRYGSFKEALRYFINRSRFSRQPASVTCVYHERIRALWPFRNI